MVSGLPLTGDHPMHPLAIDAAGDLFVDVATATNACQAENRVPGSPGLKPCVEKATRGGIWRYDANKTGQAFSARERFATGLRNGEGIGFDGQGRIYATQHGRDQLYENWPDLYSPEQGHDKPSEELVQLRQGADYGWPECYFDGAQGKLVLAPEYGGDGGKATGVCAGSRRAHRRLPGPFRPRRHGDLPGVRVPGRLQGRRLHCLPWLVEPGAGAAGRLRRRLPAARRRGTPAATGWCSPTASRRASWSRRARRIARPGWRSDRAGRSTSPTTSAAVSGASPTRAADRNAPVTAAPSAAGGGKPTATDAQPPEGTHPDAGR